MTGAIRHTIRIPDGESLLDLEDDLRSIFDVTTDNVSPPIQTAGELFDFIRAEMANAPHGMACPTLMAFNRIRKVLTPYAQRSDIRASTPLSHFGWPAKRWAQVLERNTKLEAPDLGPTILGMIGFVSFFGGCAIGAIAVTTPAFDIVYSIGAVTAGVLMIILDPGAWTSHYITIGDLAAEVARRNFARLAREGGRLDDEDLWKALVTTLESRSLPDTGQIVRETRFG